MRPFLSVPIIAAAAVLAGLPIARGAEGLRTFVIDEAASTLTIRIFRAGLFSVFAHDHLLVARGIAGRVRYDDRDVSQSSLQLSVPVGSLIVDDPEHREREGMDGEFSEEDIQEVRETLLSEAFLDEGNHPRIVATAVDITGEPPLLNLGLNVRIKQTEKVIRVPIRVTVDEETFRAVGELYLLQSDFGIEPFSSYLGFISVKDTIQIRFDILGRTLE